MLKRGAKVNGGRCGPVRWKPGRYRRATQSTGAGPARPEGRGRPARCARGRERHGRPRRPGRPISRFSFPEPQGFRSFSRPGALADNGSVRPSRATAVDRSGRHVRAWCPCRGSSGDAAESRSALLSLCSPVQSPTGLRPANNPGRGGRARRRRSRAPSPLPSNSRHARTDGGPPGPYRQTYIPARILISHDDPAGDRRSPDPRRRDGPMNHAAATGPGAVLLGLDLAVPYHW